MHASKWMAKRFIFKRSQPKVVCPYRLWKAGCVTLLLSMLVFVIFSTSSPVTATFPGRNGKIAFASTLDGNLEIYSMDPDGSNLTRLTDNPASDNTPAWSPDGMKIAFSSDRDGDFLLYIMNADGSDVAKISEFPGWTPAWSPDGTKIAFTGRGARGVDVFVMDADGSNLTNLSNYPGDENSPIYSDDLEPVWSPDGTKIAFVSSRILGHGIYIMDANGENQTRISPLGDWRWMDDNPNWSPDGTKIVFAGTRSHPMWEIYVIDIDGSNQTRLTNDYGLYFKNPTFSPDGTKIVMAGCKAFCDIYIMNSDGSAITNMTNHLSYYQWFSWQTLPETPPSNPPLCVNAYPSLDLLVAANHKFVPVEILGVTDPDGDSLTIEITGIYQDEPVDERGDGSFTPDGKGIGEPTAYLRAERSGRGNGRVYTLYFTAQDVYGESCSGVVHVGVEHSRKKEPINDGALFDSTVSSP
jgi:Tol biopolymer transport system component